MNNITICDDGDVVRRGATNIFFKLIMLDFFRLLCVGNESESESEIMGPVRKKRKGKHKC